MSELAEVPRKSTPEERPRSGADKLLLAIAAIAVLSVVYVASSVLAPVACALFIIALAWPTQNWLQSRIPKMLALAIVIAIIAVIFLIFGSLISWGFGRVARWIATDAERFQMLYARDVRGSVSEVRS